MIFVLNLWNSSAIAKTQITQETGKDRLDGSTCSEEISESQTFSSIPHPNFYRSNFQDNSWAWEDQTLASLRVKKEPPTRSKSPCFVELKSARFLTFLKSCGGSRGQRKKSPHLMCNSRLFSGRPSPLNMSRSSTFGTAKAPEANLESSDDAPKNLHRGILRTGGPHCCRVTPMSE